jgi:predicted peroxiredoxin
MENIEIPVCVCNVHFNQSFLIMKYSQFVCIGMAALLFLSSCQDNQTTGDTSIARENEEKTGSADFLLNLTSDAFSSPHNTLMGLHLAQKALSGGINATVFLNVDGVKLMAAGADTISFHNENLHEVLKAFMNEGGKVLACPHCMEVHGIADTELVEGVIVAKDDQLLEKLKEGPTVFTY